MGANNTDSLKERICFGLIPKNYLPNGQPNHFDYGQIEVPENYVFKYKITTGNSIPLTVVSTKKDLSWHRRGSRKKRQFTIKTPNELIIIRAEITITIEAVKNWVKTWCPQNSVLITPSKKSLSLDSSENNNKKFEYIYFIYNEHSKAIKIGRAINVEKRFKSLQTASPAILKLLGVKCVEARRPPYHENNDFHDEQLIHYKFHHLRIHREWFKAEEELLEYIEKECVKLHFE
ncbi:hypothetical protein STA3757_06930 [Stanieria sp. NIES-3757]|nr:hypothetical protein STA3757_06930 [Stanieria sp. NIES-3757]